MKKFSLFLCMVLFLLASCTQDILQSVDGSEACKVRFSLRVADLAQGSGSIRSTDLSTVEDAGVDNLWVLQFENGVFKKKVYIAAPNPADLELELVANESGKTSNVYFVANVGSSVFATPPSDEAAYKAMTMPITSEAACLFQGSSKKFVPMSGELLGITVGFGQSMNSTLLYRMFARIDYTYSVDASLGFIVKNIRLCGVPATALYDTIRTAKYPADGVSTQTFEYEVATHATTEVPKTLTFYVPDNRRGTGTNTALSNDKLKLGLAGATSIQLVGYTTGPNGGDEITYTLYPGGDAYNDYNVRRNTIYKMTTNIVGLAGLTDARFKKTETSNCYIVAPGGTVSIPVKRANSSDLGSQLPDVTKDWTASTYWQTAPSLVTVSNADKSSGCFTVTASSGSAKGNAVVVVKNTAGDIVWSWHIWVVDYNPETENETQNGNVWMSRNLGATALAGSGTTFATCGGLYYQWGRKDPFPGSDCLSDTTALPIYGAASSTPLTSASTSISWPSVGSPTATSSAGDVVKYATLGATPSTQIPFANQLAYSVKYPLMFLRYWAGSTATTAAAYTVVGGRNSWGGEYGDVKSVYDPCPAGWRVPSGRRVSSLYASPWNTWNIPQPITKSFFSALKWNTVGSYYYPAAGCRRSSSGELGYVGVYGFCWGASPLGSSGYYIYFGNDVVYPSDSFNRENGYELRCVQEH